ncbi:Arc family DNA-binding protein [Acetobacter syzygii]|uniref:Arc family DNA-binding protein n=1 Tax=Acetobacter syzygii TaxID=146476 RepID=UPI00157048D9|nr:Arc family DNA-binding protein [Acetobacter syzygii]NSL91696.1 Arc family DNA-binding protein [Acetobacter syzygii]
MARDDPMMRFRAPTELKARIEEAAAKNGRSLNAEIVQRLDASLSGRPILDVSESEGLDSDERSLVRLWRAINDTEQSALRTLVERLADKARSSG